jgi:alkylation response protein AidB-like acyl-CoA dehydrogenase
LLFLAAAMGCENGVFHRDGEVTIGVTSMTGSLVRMAQKLAGALMGDADRWGWVRHLYLWLGFVAGVVLGAGMADVLLLASGEDMLVVERTAAGVAIDVPENLDRSRRSGRVVLTGVAVGDNTLPGARNAALARTRTLYAAEAVGGASDCVDSAVEYAKVREQFGRTIATFQAVKHHCANMLVAAESAVSCVWDAARAADEDEEQFRLIAAAAATLAFPAYVRNAELNIQVHGGIGFTWEHDAHLHLRRALTVHRPLRSRRRGGPCPS